MCGPPDEFSHRVNPLTGFAPLQSRLSISRSNPKARLVQPTQRVLPKGDSRCYQDPSPVPRTTSPLRFSRPSSAISDASPLFVGVPRRVPRRRRLFQSRRLAAFRVSHPLDGFLLASPCRFLSPDKRSWGSVWPVVLTSGMLRRSASPLADICAKGDRCGARTLAGACERPRRFHRNTSKCPWATYGHGGKVPPPCGRPEGLPGGCSRLPLQAEGSGYRENLSDQVGSAPSSRAKRDRSLRFALDSRHRVLLG